MSFSNRDSFIPFFLIWMTSIFFSCPITLARISNTSWKEAAGENILVLFLILKGNIHPFTLKYDISIRFFADALYEVTFYS